MGMSGYKVFKNKINNEIKCIKYNNLPHVSKDYGRAEVELLRLNGIDIWGKDNSWKCIKSNIERNDL